MWFIHLKSCVSILFSLHVPEAGFKMTCDVIFLFGANSSSASKFHIVTNIVFSTDILPIGILFLCKSVNLSS